MGRHRNKLTGVVVSVDDSKDYRFGDGWENLGDTSQPEPTPAKKPVRKTSNTTD